jgi:serine/threonine protein phosphatase PrpC
MRDNIDLSTSGSTMVSCYLLQNKLYCANVGDSRAIMGVKDKNGKWSAKALSNDHKPSLPLEAQRIYRFNGRIDSLRDHYGNNGNVM